MSTTYNAGSAYRLAVTDSTLQPSDYRNKLGGMPLRFLINSTGSTKARRYPLSYILPGVYRWGIGDLYVQGSDGRWWSTTASSSTNAYDLTMDSSELNPQHDNGKTGSLTLRCTIQIFFFQKIFLHRLNQSPPVSAFVYIIRVLQLD